MSLAGRLSRSGDQLNWNPVILSLSELVYAYFRHYTGRSHIPDVHILLKSLIRFQLYIGKFRAYISSKSCMLNAEKNLLLSACK